MRTAFPVVILIVLSLLPAGTAYLGIAPDLAGRVELVVEANIEAPVGVAARANSSSVARFVDVGAGDYIVGYKEGQRGPALLAIQLAGGEVKHVDPDVRLALTHVKDTTRLEALLMASATIEFIEPDGPIRAAGVQWNGAEWNGAEWNGAEWNGAEWNAMTGAPSSANDPGRTLQWGLAAIDAPAAWAVSTGERAATLCVLDSGLAWDHPDIAANSWTGPYGGHGYNAINGTAWAYDDAGHGTHVAGIAAAHIGNAWGTAGVGNVRIVPVKVLDSQGHGTESALAFGIAWCARQGVDVALMALSVSAPGPALDAALAFAASRDVTLVASAGNTGECADCVTYPASHPAVIAVSSIGVDLSASTFSSAGAKVELAAPGENILAPFLGGRFVYGNGTSQAAAHAAGAAALLRDTYPGLTAAQTRAVLTATATDLGAPGRDAAYGHGLVDMQAAMERAASL